MPRKSRAYYRMAHEAHQRGDHRLGNHWSRRAAACERAVSVKAHVTCVTVGMQARGIVRRIDRRRAALDSSAEVR